MATKQTAKAVETSGAELSVIEDILNELGADTEGGEVVEAATNASSSAIENEIEEIAEDVVNKLAEEKASKAKTAKAPKEKAPARVFFSKQSDRVAHLLGEKVGEFAVLELADATLTGDELKAKNDEVIATLDVMAKKVGEKAYILMKWLKNGGELNEVMKRAFEVLVKEGKLTSGDKGNLQTNLLAKPYSLGTARSQANQMFMLFPLLKITVKSKGEMVPNPNSLILMKVKSVLGL